MDQGAGEARTAAERMAETRTRLLEAVLESLAECGYAATSTTEVARRSGLTRGAQLHHFGTKDQMMVAAVEYLEQRIREVDVEAALAHLAPGRERVLTALPILSQLFSSTLADAYVELWVASRTHPELADALRRTDVAARDAVRSLFGERYRDSAGTEFDALIDLTMYAVRGMTLDAHLATDGEQQDREQLILGLAPYFESAMETER